MMISGSICLGDKLGLYKSLYQVGPVSCEDFAFETQLNKRYLKEWLEGQVAAGILKYNNAEKTFSISQDYADLLADESKSTFMGGIFAQIFPLSHALEQLPSCFETGEGLSFDELGPHTTHFQQRVFEAWYRNELVDTALITLEGGVVDKLEQGAKVADIGCGSGMALIILAKRFPNSTFHGFEISQNALEHAVKNKEEHQLANISFFDIAKDQITNDHSYDLITAFDCIPENYPKFKSAK